MLIENKQKIDTLIVTTLAYLKSEDALPVLYTLVENFGNEISTLILAISIFEINNDERMISIAIDSATRMDKKMIHSI